jgi:hypothetical protein
MTHVELDQDEINALNEAGHQVLAGEIEDLTDEQQDALEHALQKIGRYAT